MKRKRIELKAYDYSQIDENFNSFFVRVENSDEPKILYYNDFTRQTQWEFPINKQLLNN